MNYVVFRIIDSSILWVGKYTGGDDILISEIPRNKPFFIDVWHSNRIIFRVTNETIFFAKAVVLGEYLSIVNQDWLYDKIVEITVIDLKHPGVKKYVDPETVPYRVLEPQEVPEIIKNRVMGYITFFVLQGLDYFLFEGLNQFDGVRLSPTKIPGFRTGWWE